MAKTIYGEVSLTGDEVTIDFNAFGFGTAMTKRRVINLADLVAFQFVPASALSNGELNFQTAQGRTSLLFRKKQQDEIIPISMAIEERAPFAVGKIPEGPLMVGSGKDNNLVTANELSEMTPEQAYLQKAKMGAAIASLGGERKRGTFRGVELWSNSIRQGRATYPLIGAIADVEMGASKERITATRVGLGAFIAGPVGAVVGANSKKSQTKGYLSITTQEGSVLIEFSAKEEAQARRFAADVIDAEKQAAKAS